MTGIPVFAAATLTPAFLIALGALWGGGWVWLALGYMTLLAAGLDALIRTVPEAAEGSEFPAADGLSALLALLHLAILPVAVWAVGGPSGLDLAHRLGLGLAASLWFGQVSNANAHELIHRGRRGLFLLGKWVYISLLFGHHTSAHRLVHHRFVGLPDDPNTPRRGEGFYRFWPRAWLGSFRAGWRAEAALGRRGWRHPYRDYLGGAALCLVLAWVIGGRTGVAAYLAMALHAQMQLLLSDYVQHYGLARRPGARGVTPDLSWNAPHWFTGHLMLNAPRHSDHHAHPTRPFPALRLAPTGTEPMLPHSLPVMAAVALVPPLWRRMMAPRLARMERDAGS